MKLRFSLRGFTIVAGVIAALVVAVLCIGSTFFGLPLNLSTLLLGLVILATVVSLTVLCGRGRGHLRLAWVVAVGEILWVSAAAAARQLLRLEGNLVSQSRPTEFVDVLLFSMLAVSLTSFVVMLVGAAKIAGSPRTPSTSSYPQAHPQAEQVIYLNPDADWHVC
ncbi:hypothetical protein [Arthrobacter cryoconiti]|uniref:Uncharacterized protein n=1 Tax=Arthrobacter cryoconiti TaxID=748907 RepID=A0ABV8R3N6_9MICC|nr:hypothetical protein [Arthrobacter cryoconiti]MCC9067159.1 hypothetical protein [Arthrobacter cryoconiti]